MLVWKIPSSILLQLENNSNVQVEDIITDVKAEEYRLEQSLFCSTCNLNLDDKNHFKSDFHRFNLKRKLKGLEVLDEYQFDELDEISSIDGSDSDEDNQTVSKREEGSPLASFLYTEGDVRKELLVYKQILHSKTKERVDYISRLKELQVDYNQNSTFWSMFLLSSGHFVGAVINLESGKPILHKSFHRYTTRRKQGGAQSSNDKSKGKAKSAGAGIRRYNEQALNEEIQELLFNWRERIEKSALIFLRAPVGMRSTLLFENSPLRSNGNLKFNQDDKIRTFPFVTKRPTLSEVMRCFEELSIAKTRNYEVKKEKEKASPIVDSSKIDANVEKIIEALRKGNIEILTSLSEIVDVNYKLPDSKGISFLHIAASNTNPKIVEWLLENGADPTRRGEKLKTLPYDAADSKLCRDTFRKFMAKYPAKWDYNLTNIPSPLTEVMEEEARRREKERRRKERDKKKAQKKLDAPMVSPEAEIPHNSAAVTKFKNLSLAGLRKTDKELLGMSPEQRMRLDREKRALAAESRLRSQKNECGNCGTSLIGMKSFDKSIYRYCSMECLKVI